MKDVSVLMPSQYFADKRAYDSYRVSVMRSVLGGASSTADITDGSERYLACLKIETYNTRCVTDRHGPRRVRPLSHAPTDRTIYTPVIVSSCFLQEATAPCPSVSVEELERHRCHHPHPQLPRNLCCASSYCLP